jgi:hypothetical protein
MATTTLNITSQREKIRERAQILLSLLRSLFDALVSNRMRHAAAEAEHVQPRLSVQKRPEGDADDERFRAQPTDSHATVVAHLSPFDPRILNAIFVVRNKEGFRVARDAKGQFRGMFLREQSAVSFARGHSRPVERTMASPSRTIQLDLKSKGNPLPVNCISVRFHQESWRPNRNIRNAVVRGLTRFLMH